MTIEPTLSATISGKKTNRIRVNRVRVKRLALTGKQAKIAFRKDPTVRGLQVGVVCISLPAAELAHIDDACSRVQMARSHLLREAAKQFIAGRSEKSTMADTSKTMASPIMSERDPFGDGIDIAIAVFDRLLERAEYQVKSADRLGQDRLGERWRAIADDLLAAKVCVLRAVARARLA